MGVLDPVPFLNTHSRVELILEQSVMQHLYIVDHLHFGRV